MTRRFSPLPLRCPCGRVHGVADRIGPSAGWRCICYCEDCQAFARFLRRPDVLDPAGGTDIFQMPTGRVRFEAGHEAVRCLRFSKHVIRWYADCCRTPIGNTGGPRVPMVGLVHSLMDHQADGRSRDEALGPPLCRIFEGSVAGPLPPDAPTPPLPGLFALLTLTLIGWWARGLARPNPFFDDRTKAPLSAPRVLTPSERAALDDAP